MEYDKYLETEHWKQKRQETLDWWGHKCCICAASEKLEVHHNSCQLPTTKVEGLQLRSTAIHAKQQ